MTSPSACGAILIAFVSSATPMNACPDERVAAIDLTVSPVTARERQPTLVTFSFDSKCPAPVSWRIEVGSKTIASGTQQAQPLPGGVITIAATWLPETSGDHVVRGIVDPDNLLSEPESARGNNVVTRAVHVVAAPQPVSVVDSQSPRRSRGGR